MRISVKSTNTCITDRHERNSYRTVNEYGISRRIAEYRKPAVSTFRVGILHLLEKRIRACLSFIF